MSYVTTWQIRIHSSSPAVPTEGIPTIVEFASRKAGPWGRGVFGPTSALAPHPLYSRSVPGNQKGDKLTASNESQHRFILQRIAHRAMIERGLAPDFPSQALAELDRIAGPASPDGEPTRDLRRLLWCSIDNDSSRDLDQLTVAEAMPGGATRVLFAIADVDALVQKESSLDDHAQKNTTSVY